MTPADLAAGYDHRLAISRLEVSLIDVFDRLVQGGNFFETLIRETGSLCRGADRRECPPVSFL